MTVKNFLHSISQIIKLEQKTKATTYEKQRVSNTDEITIRFQSSRQQKNYKLFRIQNLEIVCFQHSTENYSGHLEHTKMWDNQLSLTENIISILCLSVCPSRFSLSQTEAVCNFSTAATFSLTIYHGAYFGVIFVLLYSAF